jgi:flagellar basal-body rod modification protein FlgD
MAASVGGISGIGTDQFLTLLIAQIQNQNPLEPVSDTDFLNQLAQFSTVQGIQTLNASFGEMLKLQQLTQGSELLGKQIEFTQDDGTSQTGRVNSVVVDNGKILLEIGNGTQVPLDQVKTIIS